MVLGVKFFYALAKLVLGTCLVAILGAATLAPIAGIGSVAVARTQEAMHSDVRDLAVGDAPGVTTIKDASGTNMAYLFKQRRHPVKSDQISQTMKDAIVAIEDRRFYEHEGVDFQGNFRAMAMNVLAGGVSQGASTLDQQYVKNYLLLVDAEDEEDQQAATERSVGRKLREIRMAVELDKKLGKEEILTNYLNLVPFGNHAYGVEAAARTYFGVNAADLNLEQSALLAGLVQSSEYLNPYTNPQGALERRNTVLQSMVGSGVIDQALADATAAKPLGVLETPATLPNGCIAAGDRGFFCDYVVSYLNKKGIDADQLARGGYTIQTTLDPAVQDAAKAAVISQTSPQADGVAEVMSVIKPSTSNRPVLAMVSSRTYGLDLNAYQTMLPQPYSRVGNGAGSVFKVFTAAAALEAGYGIKTQLNVPARYEASGLGEGGARNCPPGKYCVENAGSYAPTMTLEDALAYSPNTPFIQLLEQVGVSAIVDKSVKMGLRSYTDKDSHAEGQSIAQFAKDANMGSYTLGPTAVNPLELSNVGATLAAGGMWCEPDPVTSIKDAGGNEVFLDVPPCERALDEGVAKALSHAMLADTAKGTASDAARAMGFGGMAAAKTGTTESNQSSAFLGFNSEIAAAPYIYNDGTTTTPLCTGPVRQCGSGDLFGGREPARSFYALANQFGGTVDDYDRAYDNGKANSLTEKVKSLGEAGARQQLEAEGYTVEVKRVPGFGVPAGAVMRVVTTGDKKVSLQISDGTGYVAPAPNNRGNGGNADGNNGQGQAPADPNAQLQQELDNLANEIRNALGF